MARTRRSPNHTQTDNRHERFSLHFPRLFAFVFGMTGNEEAARETTTAAFASVLHARALDEHDFTIALYSAACRLTPKNVKPAKDGLSGQEREILSLLFDAQLSRTEVRNCWRSTRRRC